MTSREIFVAISIENKNILVGKLFSHSYKGRESASFEYDKTWLKHPKKFSLEPALSLTDGSFHTKPHQAIFGAIGDSAPDRWGRVLMRRANTKRAKEDNKTPHTLSELDYLLGVNDHARQGALRFSETPGGPFLSSNNQHAIPPLVELPKLLGAAERLFDDHETSQDLQLLLAPGSSLGGARPKACVRDNNGNLAIAKFPRKDDDFQVVIWEAIALTLAKNAGITIPSWRLTHILEKPVLIINRFDRFDQNRIPFLSAMSMLEAQDNEPHSYLEMVYALAQHGAAPNEDMAQLWRRIVFSILISNTDDHLRNHAFLYEQPGWRLSPAYDLNPTPIEIKPRILTTFIDFDDNTASLEIALSVIEDFRLSKEEARKIIKEVAKSVGCWREVAKRFNITKQEIDRFESAFEHDDLKKARIS